jgi:rsbT co-antagonist protein RsbR
MDQKRIEALAERLAAMADHRVPSLLTHTADDPLGQAEHQLNRLIEKHSATAQEELLFEIGPIVVFRWRNAEGWPVEYVSPNVTHLTGYPRQDFLSGARPYAGLIHHDDIARVTEEVQTNSQGGGAWFEHRPYRVIRNGGRTVWVADYTVIRRDLSGVITHYFGYIFDITERIEQQRTLLRQLIIPVLQVWKGVLALPVLGAVDEDRAAQMTETLLHEVSRSSASVAILDLTGVENIDTSTMNHLIGMVRAVGLLGCRCVISGIAPSVAKVVVGLDVDLHDLVTFGTLEGALSHALGSRRPRGG